MNQRGGSRASGLTCFLISTTLAPSRAATRGGWLVNTDGVEGGFARAEACSLVGQASANTLGCQSVTGGSWVAGTLLAAGRSLPWVSLAFALAARSQRPFWVFSSGPVGDPSSETDPAWLEPPRVIEQVTRLGVREHVVFGGRLLVKPRGPMEHAMVKSTPPGPSTTTGATGPRFACGPRASHRSCAQRRPPRK
jgi:hypothetical protein